MAGSSASWDVSNSVPRGCRDGSAVVRSDAEALRPPRAPSPSVTPVTGDRMSAVAWAGCVDGPERMGPGREGGGLSLWRHLVSPRRAFLRGQLLCADELLQGCLLHVKGLCEDAASPGGDAEGEDGAPAVCLVKVGDPRTAGGVGVPGGQAPRSANKLSPWAPGVLKGPQGAVLPGVVHVSG